MNVYILQPLANDYQSLLPAKKEDWGRSRTFDGRSQVSAWVPLLVTVHGAELPQGDYPSSGTQIPIFSHKAKDCLGDMLAPHGEFLPLIAKAGEYYAFNITTVIDALDEERSEVKRFRDGQVMRIVTYQFHVEKLMTAPIFKLRQDPLEDPLVTDEFVRRAHECGLTGMGFTHVWSG